MLNNSKTKELLIIYLHLNIFFQIAYLQDLASIKGVKGGNVTLSCTVPETTGDNLPTISWEKVSTSGLSTRVASSFNGVSFINNGTLKDRARMRGGDLLIFSLLLTDEGTYICTVYTPGNWNQDNPIALLVTAAPTVQAFSVMNPILNQNNTYVAAVCIADGGKPAAEVQWINSFGKIEHSSAVQTFEEDGSVNIRSELILTPRTSESLSNTSTNEVFQVFTCRVIHVDFLNLNQSQIDVNVHLLSSPEAHISIFGNRLLCSANGNPAPTLKWFLPTGDVVINQSSIFLGQDPSYNGRYSCQASSYLKPNALVTIDIQKARDLPVMFRTIERLNASLPITASGYKIACSAEFEMLENSRNSFEFEWMKNGTPITESHYRVTTKQTQLASTRYSLESILTIRDVMRDRDDAIFECRMSNASTTDFVIAVERVIAISVDYPPETIKINGEPRNLILMKGEKLNLTCSVDSKPSSTYQWHFKGEILSSGATLTIPAVQRHNAGTYECLAYNYVPGSLRSKVKVLVQYPPYDVALSETTDGKLSCLVNGGSFPPPMYTWIYPNGSRTKENISCISLLAPPSHGSSPYTCIASNFIGSINSTFIQSAPLPQKIGVLSLTVFIVVISVGIIIVCLFAGFVAWSVHRRRAMPRASHKKTADEAFQHYLQFVEPPRNVEAYSGNKSHSSSANSVKKAQIHLQHQQQTSNMKGSNQVEFYTYKPAATRDDYNEETVSQSTSYDLSTKDNLPIESRTSTFRANSAKTNDNNKPQSPICLTSFRYQPKLGTLESNASVKSKQPGEESSSNLNTFSDTQLNDEKDDDCNTNTETEAPRRAHEVAPYRYFTHDVPMTHSDNYSLPMRVKGYPRSVRVLPSGYNPSSQTQTWSTHNPNILSNPLRTYSSTSYGSSNTPNPFEQYQRSEDASSCSNPPGNFVSTRSINARRRSISLSDSSLSEQSSNNFVSSGTKNRSPRNPDLLVYKTNKQPSRTLSPFDSGNDSARSLQVSLPFKKQQSLTLV